jgi:triosephosphate isomerase
LGLVAQRISFQTVAQSVSSHTLGSHTGAIGASYLQKLRVRYALLGHKETRLQGLTDREIALNYHACLLHDIQPILCFGSPTLEELKYSIEQQLGFLSSHRSAEVYLAYEPYWAIGQQGINCDLQHLRDVYELVSSIVSSDCVLKFFYGGGLDIESTLKIIQLPFISGVLLGKMAIDLEKIKHLQQSLHKNSVMLAQ